MPSFRQAVSDPDFEKEKEVLKTTYSFYTALGLAYNAIEVTSYAVLYHFIFSKDTNLKHILNPSVIESRNRVNAISLSGWLQGDSVTRLGQPL